MSTQQDQYQIVKTRIANTCRQCGRATQAVRLLAVSKMFDVQAIRALYEMGQQSFGENYVQEALGKIEQLVAFPIIWHLIGPLQSNKTKVVAEHFSWVESIDREKIVQRLNEQRPKHLPPLNVCIQVKIDGGKNKSGIVPSELPALAQMVASLPRLKLRGLLFIPEPQVSQGDQKAIFDQCADLYQSMLAKGYDWDTLSLGMSHDLEAAIASGSTEVRIGSAIFGTRLGSTDANVLPR